jgi:hypothetical protein
MSAPTFLSQGALSQGTILLKVCLICLLLLFSTCFIGHLPCVSHKANSSLQSNERERMSKFIAI